MDKHFYVSDGMNKVGPFSKEEVYQMLFNAHISITDFILDSRDNRMCPLMQHEDFGGAGSNLSTSKEKESPKKPAETQPHNDQFGFAELRKQGNKFLRNNNVAADRVRTVKESPQPSLRKITPTLTASQIFPKHELSQASDILKNNSSINFYVKNKDKEYGPLKFLVLLSLLKQNKLKPEIQTRTESDREYRPLSHFLPKELLQTIQVTPTINPDVLPKTHWQRKNVRIDYDELILLNNASYSLVARSLDLSTGGISVLWVYDLPLNEVFEISLFDTEQNIVTVEARLARKETVQSNSPLTLYKSVFLFSENIQIKNFIK